MTPLARGLCLTALAVTTSCAFDTAEEPDFHGHEAEPVGEVQLALGTVYDAAISSCTTTSVKGLSEQIVAQMNCIVPGAMDKVPTRPNLSFSAAVFPYMQTPGKTALLKAVDANPSKQMSVSSMFRNVAQQYLLYQWYLSKKCGISLAAKPGSSNHESGVAIDISEYSTWKTPLTNNGFKWLGSADPWHYDYVGGGAKNLKGTDVLAFQMLWNLNNPGDKIGEDGAYGPQTEARLKKSPAGGFAKPPSCGPADSDGDGVVDTKDNCVSVKNANQLDTDGDGQGDACDSDDDGDGVADAKDNCPLAKNATQVDTDNDGKGDACVDDDDGDGVPDAQDNCPKLANPDQADSDKDGKGDACAGDADGDGVMDAQDNCPSVSNADQMDTDGDKLGDACDDDLDGDGIQNGEDLCPADATATQDDTDGDGLGDACDDDLDGDGVKNDVDNCVNVANPDQAASQSPGIGDACLDLPGSGGGSGTQSTKLIGGDSGGCALSPARDFGAPPLGLAALAGLLLLLRRRAGRFRPTAGAGSCLNPRDE